MARRRQVITVWGASTAATAPEPVPYQWRKGGRSRDAALQAAGLGTGTLTSAPPRRRHKQATR
jgi:hypothetical protein